MKTFVLAMLMITLGGRAVVMGAESNKSVDPDAVYTFKQVGDVTLELNVYQPKDWKASDRRPAIVLFFGGGWVGGDKDHFKRQAIRYAELGMVAITPDYRTKKKNGTTPFESVADAKSAMRWVYKNADKLGIDTKMIAAGGGSAGGHLAAATALIKAFDDPQDDTSVSPVPSLLVLFNPVIDNGPGIDRDLLPRIFHPMVSSRAEGTGMGLPIAQYLIHLHDGLIECESRPGQTVFSVFLPMREASE